MRALLTATAIVLIAQPLSAATRRNDDSCDIAAMPAATLLLPYFEVGYAGNSGAMTALVTVTNTSPQPQIARITLWTDWAYPVYAWNAVLTGYDTYAFNMRDVLDGRPPASGTQNGARSLSANPRLSPDALASCSAAAATPPQIMDDVRFALLTGVSKSCAQSIGSRHPDRAVGYATIDLVSNCSTHVTTDAEYASELLYDNVLTGDAIQVNANPAIGNYAGANPLVHIRAVPEGGAAGEVVETNLPYTFYGTLMPAAAPKADRRQPLPSRFAMRFIEGGASGFVSDAVIWRAPLARTTCQNAAPNSNLRVNSVRFDERENPFVIITPCYTLCIPVEIVLPNTSRTATSASAFPVMTSGDVAGWLYLDLDHRDPTTTTPTQSWVSVWLQAEGRYMAAHDAVALGNGCSPQQPIDAPIRPTP
ncbi:MAG TPA: hypothetical protein VFN10_08760 [Thermoanaerobaculia bacterium]|nr:hypothetical protein [Thermoanaerobaculia bacterium]